MNSYDGVNAGDKRTLFTFSHNKQRLTYIYYNGKLYCTWVAKSAILAASKRKEEDRLSMEKTDKLSLISITKLILDGQHRE